LTLAKSRTRKRCKRLEVNGMSRTNSGRDQKVFRVETEQRDAEQGGLMRRAAA